MKLLTFLPANFRSLYPEVLWRICLKRFGRFQRSCWHRPKKLFRVFLDIVQDEPVELCCWFFFELPKRIIKDLLPLRSRNILEEFAPLFDICRHLYIGKEGGSFYEKVGMRFCANAHQCCHHCFRIAAASVVEELLDTSVPDFAGEEP